MSFGIPEARPSTSYKPSAPWSFVPVGKKRRVRLAARTELVILSIQVREGEAGDVLLAARPALAEARIQVDGRVYMVGVDNFNAAPVTSTLAGDGRLRSAS